MCKSECKYSSDLQIVFGISASGFDQQVPTFDNHDCLHHEIVTFIFTFVVMIFVLHCAGTIA